MRSLPELRRSSRLAALALAASSPPLFAQHFPGEQHEALASATSVASLDVDGDGTVDAVLAGSTSSSLALFSGADGFSASSFVPCGLGSRAVVVGDATGDGKPDLVVARHGFNVLALIAGDGAGSFAAPFSVPMGADPSLVRLSDLNLDGTLDVIALLSSSDRIGIRFGPATPQVIVPFYVATGNEPAGLVAADLDGDGDPDLAVAEPSPNGVAVFRGDGAGGFAPADVYPVPSFVVGDVAAGDVNGDGALDLEVVLLNGGARIFLGSPPGFGSPISVSVSGFVTAGLGDWNGDGRLDLISGTSDPAVLVVLGNGDGSFGATKTLASGSQPRGVEPRDIDGDGDLDLFVANTSGTLGVIVNEGGGNVGSQTLLPAGGGTGASLIAGDLDGDGAADVVVPLASTSIFLHGAAGFVAPSTVLATPGATRAAAADVDHDGALDLAIPTGGLKLFKGQGNGTFAAPTPIAGTDFVADLVFLDATGDGNADLASVGTSSLRLRVGDGVGGFAAPLTTTLAGSASSLSFADLDGDGVVDVVVPHSGASSVSLLFGNGAGGFSATSLAVASGPVRAVPCDVNADGFVDLTTLHTSGTAAMRLGNGTAQFGPPVTFNAGCIPSALAVADVDADGAADYVVGASCAGADVIVVFGSPSGIPGSRALVSTTYASTSSLALADLDGDGKPELLAGHGHDVTALANITAAPAGAVPFGSGTPGCMGILGLAANEAAKVGSSTFGVIATNAPANALGLGLRTNVAIPGGGDTFGLGLQFHVDLLGATDVAAFDAFSDAGGSAFGKSPIPKQPALSGATVYYQTIWLPPAFSTCSDAVLGLISSRGLAVTIQ